MGKKKHCGRRPPPDRTYGSKHRPGRVVRPNQDYLRTVPDTHLSGTHQQRELVHPRNQTLPTGSTKCETRQVSSSSVHGNKLWSAEEILRMIHSAGEGGQRGRAAAVAVAQACKSLNTRKAMDVDGVKSILTELSKVTHKMLRRGSGQRQQDEAIVHCLAVSLFTLSKDRLLVQRFDPSVLSTLAFLIEGYARSDPGESSARGDIAATGTDFLKSWSVSPGERKEEKLVEKESTRLLEFQEERNPPASRLHLRASLEGPGQRGDERNTSTYHSGETLKSEKDEQGSDTPGDKAFGSVGDVGDVGVRSGEEGGEILGSAQTLAYHQAADHGSPGVMVRARMLLDIADMLPWGLANRHLVSATDLGLATMLNVVGRSSPNGGAARAENSGGNGDSIDEEFSTQGSALSRCDSMTVSNDGLSDGGKAATTGSSAMLLELGRLSCTGFLIPFVVAGAKILERLAASRRVVERDVTADPSSLRQLHRLLLALRLLDLATLENSQEGNVASHDSEVNAADPEQGLKLAGTLLCVVSRCQAVNVGSDCARRSEESAVAGAAAGQGRLGARLRGLTSNQRQPFVEEVALRVQECLLAALRVLVNLTHDDPKVCAVVGARGGLETLMLCLVAHSDCEVQESDDDSSPLASCWRSDSGAFFGSVTSRDVRHSMDDVDNRVERRQRAGGDFDAQILSMGALINCVELQESADNCATVGTLTVSPPAARPSAEPLRGRSRRPPRTCLAPEFLGRLLVFCTRSFARHLEVSRPSDSYDGDEEETSASPPKPLNDGVERRNIPGSQGRGDADSAARAAAPATHPARSAVSQGSKEKQEEEDEEEMSHTEGADLVLGGHCALLLGLLIRDQNIRHSALLVLPERTAMLIVRVLEAFMALQYQAGVLTEEVALKVQSLVEELEEIQGLPVPDEESDPFELDSEDDALSSSLPTTTNATAPLRRKGRKRPRSPAASTPQRGAFLTPLSGQWTVDASTDDCADDFSLSEACPRSSVLPEGRALPSWLPQVNGTTGASSCASDARAFPGKLPPPEPATKEAQSVASKSHDDGDTTDSRPIDLRPPRYAKKPLGARRGGWRVGSAAGGRLGLSCGGAGSALGTRNWLGGSSPPVYTPRKYDRQAWTKSARSLSRLHSSSMRGGNKERKFADTINSPEAERSHHGKRTDEADVFSMASDESENGLPNAGSGAGEEGGNGGGKSSNSGVGEVVKPNSGHLVVAPTVGTKSIFDLDCSSDESPTKLDSHAGKAKAPKATQGLPIATAGGANGSASWMPKASVDSQSRAHPRQNQQRLRQGSVSPCVKEEPRNIQPGRGIGPRIGGPGISRTFAAAAASTSRNLGVTNASLKRRVAPLSLPRKKIFKPSAHDGERDAGRPPTKHAPSTAARDRKDAVRTGQQRRADPSAALGGARGRTGRKKKTSNTSAESHKGNVFQMLDSDGDDIDASSKEAARQRVFDLGDESD